MGRNLLEAGFSRRDLETGRVSVEEAKLLGENPTRLHDRRDYAGMRMENHLKREAARRERGKETDMERFVRTGNYED